MPTEILKLHGSMFFLLKKYVDNSFPPGSWDKLMNEAKPSEKIFEMTKSYPLSDMEAIIDAASQMSGITSNQLKEKFGEFMVPDLFKLYGSYLNPEWKTFEVLENTEKVMHGAVRHLNSTAQPPILNVNKVNEKLLIIDYFSRRRLGTLAVGIIRGIATYFNQQNEITITPTSHPGDERVQIRVEHT